MTVGKQPARTAAKRPWLRFSLRTLLSVMVLVAVFCGGWVSHRLYSALEDERANSDGVTWEWPRSGDKVEFVPYDSRGTILIGSPGDKDKVPELIERIEKAARE